MPVVRLYPLGLKVVTGENGSVDFSLSVPGTFAGITDDKPGRFLSRIEVWTENGTDGDLFSDMRLEDEESLLVPSGASALFPLYPVLTYFEDRDITPTENMKRGIFIKPGQLHRVEKIDYREPYEFVPARMCIKGKFTSANVDPIGKVMRVNVIWGKLV